jgi:Ca2+-transporting ATPase
MAAVEQATGLRNVTTPFCGLAAPILSAVKILAIPLALVVLATELAFLQRGLMTTSLDGLQWLACVGLALILPIVVEVDKWIRRRRVSAPAPSAAVEVVNPQRALAGAAAGSSGVHA